MSRPRGVRCPRCEGTGSIAVTVRVVNLGGETEEVSERVGTCALCSGTGTASLFVPMAQGPGETGRTWKERVAAGEDA